MFLNCHVTKGSMSYMTFWAGPLILSQHPARFWGHGPCECGDITLFDLPSVHVVDVSRDFVGGVPLS